MPSLFRRVVMLGIALTACATAMAGPVIVCSFSIPADWAKQIAGPTAEVSSLTPTKSDFHAIQPTPAQVRAITRAELVVGIHPQLETWLADLEKTGDLRRPVVWLAREAFPDLGTCDCARHHRTGRHHTHAPSAENDPHLWMDPDAAAILVDKLTQEISRLDASAGRRGADYAASLRNLTKEMQATLDSVPTERRKLVTQHDNLRRFAKKFAFTVPATLLGNSSAEGADPSARKIAATLEILRREKVPAIFADNTLARRLPEHVANEAGLPPPVTLAVDSLDTPDSPAGTYTGMMRENARRISAALSPRPTP